MSGRQRAKLTRRSAVALIGAGVAGLAVPGIAAGAKAAKSRIPTRGFNLPGWVDRETGWVAPSGAVLARLHALGFRTVRLPVAADPILGPEGAAMLGRLGRAARTLVSAGYSVIVDLHPAGDFARTLRSDPPAAAETAAATWIALRRVIAELPEDRVYPELLNEPPLERGAWLPLRDRLIRIIREDCPRHTIVWGPSRFQGIWELVGVRPPADDKAIVSVHYYTPMGFTHQCENWDSSPLRRISHLPFPATRDDPAYKRLAARFRRTGDEQALSFLEGEFAHPWSVGAINADFAKLGRWSRENDCPVMLDEFGVLDFCVDAVSRATWIRAVRQAAEANGAGWTYWELDQGFGFIKDRRSADGFDMSVIDALMKD